MVYYGDEAGMWGATDPDDRKPMLWSDLKYADEEGDPVAGSKRTDDKNGFNKSLFDYYRKLIHTRESNPALTVGSYRTLLADNVRKLFVFERESGTHLAIIGFNLSGENQFTNVKVNGGTRRFKDVLSSKSIQAKNGLMRLEIKSNWGILLMN